MDYGDLTSIPPWAEIHAKVIQAREKAKAMPKKPPRHPHTEFDDDDFVNMVFQGVKYSRDEDNLVYNENMDEVGRWDGQKIKFSKWGQREHNSAAGIEAPPRRRAKITPETSTGPTWLDERIAARMKAQAAKKAKAPKKAPAPRKAKAPEKTKTAIGRKAVGDPKEKKKVSAHKKAGRQTVTSADFKKILKQKKEVPEGVKVNPNITGVGKLQEKGKKLSREINQIVPKGSANVIVVNNKSHHYKRMTLFNFVFVIRSSKLSANKKDAIIKKMKKGDPEIFTNDKQILDIFGFK